MYFFPCTETGVFITALCHLLLATFPSKPVISRVQSGEQDGAISLLIRHFLHSLAIGKVCTWSHGSIEELPEACFKMQWTSYEYFKLLLLFD